MIRSWKTFLLTSHRIRCEVSLSAKLEHPHRPFHLGATMSDSPSQQNETVDDLVARARRGEVPRRDFLRRLVVAGLSSSAAYQILNETTASAQTGGNPRITTFAIGEEGDVTGPPKSVHPPIQPPTNPITTHAVGEETTRPPTNQITTYAVGEETQKPPTTLSYGMGEEGTRPATTMAVGEEQPYRPTPRPTTQAVGEESSVTTKATGEESIGIPKPTPTTLALGEEGTPSPRPTPGYKPSTRALGEEGSFKRTPSKTPQQLFQNIPKPWKNFRRW